MPITPTYPGVYVEEIPSGARSITGVSTSITAFLGTCRRGPIDKAVRVRNFGDFERDFGGLAADSELSYAVRQFFLNGGSEALVVRLVKDPTTASVGLEKDGGGVVLTLEAREKGFSGNGIDVEIDHDTAMPDSTFNLRLRQVDPNNPADVRSEAFDNLSMDSHDARYVERVIKDDSRLVTAKRTDLTDALGAINGTSTSAALVDDDGDPLDIGELIDASHNQLRVSANGSELVEVTINPGENPTLESVCADITKQVHNSNAAEHEDALESLTCEAKNNQIVLTSGEAGEHSRVRVLPGLANDVTAKLRLGLANGGSEKDAVAAIRPIVAPPRGSLTGVEITDTGILAEPKATLPSPTKDRFKIVVNKLPPRTVDLSSLVDDPAKLPPAQGKTLDERLEDLAARIQRAVRRLDPLEPAFARFTCKPDGKKLVLTSGAGGTDSSVTVKAADEKDIAEALGLTGKIDSKSGERTALLGGTESPVSDADASQVYVGNRVQRTGIYALEAVDLFNLLCLPGIEPKQAHAGILQDAEAYCRDRRAFLLIDAPKAKDRPADIEDLVRNKAHLPKSDHAAVYYPWVDIADPLAGGRLRRVAPSGTVAGLYARTDAGRGIWTAPAGTEATLVGVLDTGYKLSNPEHGLLNPLGVNCIRMLPVHGPVAWGARTLLGADQMASEWKYVPVRRLALYIEESLYRGLQWVTFKPNDEPLWSQIRLNAGAFMQDLFRQQAFQGSSPRQAYFVKCDGETTTQNDIDRGIVNILVGFAPLKPAEFVMIKLQQIAGQAAA
jgi:phage tail sheath protein FI